jgi:hypothetical protein
VPDSLRPVQIGDCISDCVVSFEMKQWRQFVLVEFADALVDVVREYKFEESLLIRIEVGTDPCFRLVRPFHADCLCSRHFFQRSWKAIVGAFDRDTERIE